MNILKFNIKVKIFFLTGTLSLLLQSCVKESIDVIPDVFVNATINLNNFSVGITESIIITSQMIVSGSSSLGYDNNGIILYRVSYDEFYAYDRTCPHHIENSTAVNQYTNTMFAVCPVCNSQYQLWFDGYPTDDGPSVYPLKEYKTSFNPNTFDIHIYN